jgi:hypothetical protein
MSIKPQRTERTQRNEANLVSDKIFGINKMIERFIICIRMGAKTNENMIYKQL